MIIEILLLALASTIRPTSLAATTAIMSHESRRRLMLAYVVGGLAFTIAFGVLVVGAFHGIHVNRSGGRTQGWTDIAGGAALCAFGVAVLTGRIHRHQGHDAPTVRGSWAAGLNRRLTVRSAALAGPLTHIPGIFYVLALNLIVAHNPKTPGALFAVVAYDAVWFALPIVALALCIVRPAAAQGMVMATQQWTAKRSRTLLLLTAFLLGAALIIRGAVKLWVTG